jgi:hypothetical protein
VSDLLVIQHVAITDVEAAGIERFRDLVWHAASLAQLRGFFCSMGDAVCRQGEAAP